MNISEDITKRHKYSTERNLSFKEYCDQLKSQYKLNNKILFIQIPQLVFKSFDPDIAMKRGYYAFQPTGLQYLYESLKSRDLRFKILDLNYLLLKKISDVSTYNHNQWLSILEECLRSYNPSIIGISCMFDTSIQPLMQVLDYLKRKNKSIIITGGIVATYEWENLLSRKLCHFVIEGEGENKINYLFDHMTGESKRVDSTPGIHFTYKNNNYETYGEPDVVNFKGNLIDSYSLVNIEDYYKYGSLNPFSRISGTYNSPFAAIQMQRGCRARCSFCAVRNYMGRGVRKRSVDDVFKEMEFLINKRGISHFEWLDDDLLFYKSEFCLLLKKIIENKWNITWSANNGLIARSLDEQTLKLMEKSGCIGFKVGIETGNAEILRKIRKPATLDNFRKLSGILENCGQIFVGGNYIVGFPEEKFSQMMDTFRFSLDLNLDWSAFTVCQVIRGATAFSDFQDYFENQMDSNEKDAKNFIPVREYTNGQIAVKENVLKGLEVFKIDSNSIPDEDQIKEIWFSFNLVGNFINNKNLKPDGRVKKFISWVEMSQLAYPENPYMSLFLSLAYIIDDNSKKVDDYFCKTILNSNTDYWRERFNSFGIIELMNNFPKNADGVFARLDNLQRRTLAYYK